MYPALTLLDMNYRILRTGNHKVIWQGAANSPLVTMGTPHLPPKLPLLVDKSPKPCLIYGPIRPTIPNRTHIWSAVLLQCTRHTDRLTDSCSISIGHFQSIESSVAYTAGSVLPVIFGKFLNSLISILAKCTEFYRNIEIPRQRANFIAQLNIPCRVETVG